MKVRHTLICFFFFSLQDGNNGLIEVFTGTEGGDVTIRCPFSFSGSRKIFCKKPCQQEDILIETNDVSAQKGRYSIQQSGARDYVTITQLTKSDSGQYGCRLGSSDFEIELIVIDALLDGDPSEEKTFYSRTGGNILVECYFPTSERRKYFCKGECEGEDILVQTDDFSAQRGRYSIRYEGGDPSGGFVYVGISELRRSDSGRYGCGQYTPFFPDSYRRFDLVVTDAPITSKPKRPMSPSTPSTPSATTNQSWSSTSGSSRPQIRGVWLYGGIVVVIVIVSGLALAIFCIWRKMKPDGLSNRGTSEGTNNEIVLYENCHPVSTIEDSTYQSLDAASRDQDQTYSTLTHT